VVVSRYEPSYGYLVLDPATGTRWWDDATFERSWTGAVLIAAKATGETRLADFGDERYIRAEQRARRLEYYSLSPASDW
jgi:hypothetical protein